MVIPLAARKLIPAANADQIVRSLGLVAHHYVLAVGTIEPRKNHLRLLAAFERLAASINLKLAVVGSWGWGAGGSATRSHEVRSVPASF